MSAPALELKDIRVQLGSREILRGVSLSLASGEVLALAGPNGSGKTTLLRVASGVIGAGGGRVRVRGRDAQELTARDQAREIAVVPQDAHIPFPFRAGEIVLMGRSPHLRALGFENASDVEHARRAMARVGIESLAERSVLDPITPRRVTTSSTVSPGVGRNLRGSPTALTSTCASTRNSAVKT